MTLLRLDTAPKFAIITAFAIAFTLGLGFGSDTFRPQFAHAAGQLEIDGACDPASVRPNETALILCTVTLTNNGDEALTDLSGSVFIAEECNIPGRFTFIDRTLDGALMAPLGLSFNVPDLDPGETAIQISRVAVENYSTGLTGGSVTISSATKPELTATIDLCWDVQEDASAPATNLTVTKTALRNIGDVIFLDEPEAPPQPVGGEPVPILPPSPPVGNEIAEFEVVIINVGDVTMSDVTLLDVPTGDAVFVDAEPGITGFDSLGRPFWDIGDLAPGEEFTVITAYGPPAGGNCSFADGVAVVEGTPEGGKPEDYAAFAGFGVPVGSCEFIAPDLCRFYPPDGDFPVTDSCDSDVCWATSPDGLTWPVSDCSGDVSYCWFTAPGEGRPSLSPCDASVCWVSFGGDGEFEYWGEVPCDAEFCQYTSPDGSTSRGGGDCAVPICWAEDPVGGFWQEIYGCEEFFGGDTCWFVAPDGSRASIIPCEEEVCWVSFGPGDFIGEVPCEFEFCQYTAPDGSTTATSDCEYPVCWASPPGTDTWQQVYDCGEFQEWCWFAPPGSPDQAVLSPCDYPLSLAVNLPDGGMVYDPWQLTIFDEGDVDWCWPVPPEAGDFYTFPVFCEAIESIFWFQQDDGTYVLSFGPNRGCIEPFPIDGGPVPIPPRLAPDEDVTGGDFIAEPCMEGDDSEPGVQGSSIPVEVAPAVSTPVELAEGTVDQIEPQASLSITPVDMVRGDVEVIDPSPSADVIPAELAPSDRTEPISFPEFPDNVVILPVDEDGGSTAPPGPRDGDDEVDATTEADDELEVTTEADDDLEITKLPDAGSVMESTGRSTITIAVGLALVGLLTLGTFVLRVARQRGRQHGL